MTTSRRSTSTSEHAIQSAVVKWADLMTRVMPELGLLYAVPNAGKRSARAGRWMLAEGLRPGVPDMCLPVRRGSFNALYIEHKSADGKISDDQQWWLDELPRYGNAVFVSRSFDRSREIIVAYLAGKIGPGDWTTLK